MAYTFTRTAAQIEEIHNTVDDPKNNAQFSNDIRTIAGEYRGLWPDTGGSANKGDTYQTQVSGTGTGQYFTALQNTTVDPASDDVNWRAVISNQSLGGLTNYQAASVADMITGLTVDGVVRLSQGNYWQAGAELYKCNTNTTPAPNGVNDFTRVYDTDSGRRIKTVAKNIEIPSEFRQDLINVSYSNNGHFDYSIDLKRFDVVDGSTNTKHYYLDSVNGSDGNDGLLDIIQGEVIFAPGLVFSATANTITDNSGELLKYAQVGNTATITSPLNTGDYTFTAINGRVLSVASVSADEAYPAATLTRTGTQGPVKTMLKLSQIFQAQAPNTPIHIHIKDKVLTRSFSWSQWDFTYNVDLKISANNEFNTSITGFFADLSELTWIQNGNAWVASRSGTYDVYDSSNILPDGSPSRLKKMSSTSEVNASPNTWYIDGADVWVRLPDDRDPNGDIDTILCIGTGTTKTQTTLNNRTIYLENIKVSWGSAFLFNSDQGATLVSDGCCFFANNGDNGLSTASYETVIVSNSCASYNFKDGFNYHAYSAGSKTVIEVNSKAYLNGVNNGNGINNASTAHDGINIIRVNNTYYNTDGPVVADVNGCKSFNVGVTAGDSVMTQTINKGSFVFNDSGVTPGDGTAWLLGCAGGGNDTYAIDCGSSVVVKVEDWRGMLNFSPTTVISDF